MNTKSFMDISVIISGYNVSFNDAMTPTYHALGGLRDVSERK